MSEFSIVPQNHHGNVGGGGGGGVAGTGSSSVSGFNFDHYVRNHFLIQQVNAAAAAKQAAAVAAESEVYAASSATTSTTTTAVAAVSSSAASASFPQPKKTGTTIAGCVYQGGVVLGADTRSTNDTEVAEKNCTKIHYIAPNIYCCGAGTAADTEKTTDLIASQLELLRLDMHTAQSRVVTAMTHLKRLLYRYQGHISAALVLGGVDVNGPHLYQIYPHGSTSKLSYTTMGSGSLAAMAVFESGWKDDMNEDEAVALVQRSITAGIFNDLGSGSNCDICIIRKNLDNSTDTSKTSTVVDYRRGAITPNDIAPLRGAVQRSHRLTMSPGMTPILHTSFTPHPTTTTTFSSSSNDNNAVDEMEVDS